MTSGEPCILKCFMPAVVQALSLSFEVLVFFSLVATRAEGLRLRGGHIPGCAATPFVSRVLLKHGCFSLVCV